MSVGFLLWCRGVGFAAHTVHISKHCYAHPLTSSLLDVSSLALRQHQPAPSSPPGLGSTLETVVYHQNPGIITALFCCLCLNSPERYLDAMIFTRSADILSCLSAFFVLLRRTAQALFSFSRVFLTLFFFFFEPAVPVGWLVCPLSTRSSTNHPGIYD